MRRISKGRLRDVEKKAPKPWERITVIRKVCSPNGPGGMHGPPIVDGIGSVVRTRRNQPPINIVFSEPRADLLNVEIGKLTDDEIKALGT